MTIAFIGHSTSMNLRNVQKLVYIYFYNDSALYICMYKSFIDKTK